MAITTAILATHVEHDLVDAAAQRLIDDAAAEIEERFGSDTALTEYFNLITQRGRIFLKRRALTLTTVKEGAAIDNLTTLVEDTDHQLTDNGWVVERLGTDFQPKVEIIYAPVSDSDRRDRVTIDLVRLAIQNSGLSSVKDGDHSEGALDYKKERDDILFVLAGASRTIA